MEKDIYCAALDKWGAQNQTLMVFEEMSELQKELCKNTRGADNVHAIAEEIADVQRAVRPLRRCPLPFFTGLIIAHPPPPKAAGSAP